MGGHRNFGMYKTTGGIHKSYGHTSFGVNKKFCSGQIFEVDKKFRSGHTVSATVYLTKSNSQTTKLPGVS